MFLLKKLIRLVYAQMMIIQSINPIKTYAYGESKDLVCKKEEIKDNNIIKQYKNV